MSPLSAGAVAEKGMLAGEGGSGSQNEEGDAGCGAGGTGWVSTRVNKGGSCLVLAFSFSVLWC